MGKTTVYYVSTSKLHLETLSKAEAEYHATSIYKDSGVIADIHERDVQAVDHTKVSK